MEESWFRYEINVLYRKDHQRIIGGEDKTPQGWRVEILLNVVRYLSTYFRPLINKS